MHEDLQMKMKYYFKDFGKSLNWDNVTSALYEFGDALA